MKTNVLEAAAQGDQCAIDALCQADFDRTSQVTPTSQVSLDIAEDLWAEFQEEADESYREGDELYVIEVLEDCLTTEEFLEELEKEAA